MFKCNPALLTVSFIFLDMASQVLLHPDDDLTKDDEDLWGNLLDEVKVGDTRKPTEIEVNSKTINKIQQAIKNDQNYYCFSGVKSNRKDYLNPKCLMLDWFK